jgi:hypothetical protein
VSLTLSKLGKNSFHPGRRAAIPCAKPHDQFDKVASGVRLLGSATDLSDCLPPCIEGAYRNKLAVVHRNWSDIQKFINETLLVYICKHRAQSLGSLLDMNHSILAHLSISSPMVEVEDAHSAQQAKPRKFGFDRLCDQSHPSTHLLQRSPTELEIDFTIWYNAMYAIIAFNFSLSLLHCMVAGI